MKKKPPTQPSIAREWSVVVAGGLTLAYAAWGFGGIPAWSLQILLAGGVATLLLALCPLPWRLGAGKRDYSSLQRLLSWPFFYCGLAFLLYLLIGALNPAAEVVRDSRGWWVQAMEAPWGIQLPTSVRSDYEPMNAWRIFQLHLAAFSLAFAIRAGLWRRRAARRLLWCLLLSGAAMAFVAILQDLTQADKVLGLIESSNSNFWGSFFYRNQAAGYLHLVLTGCGFFYFDYARRAYLRGQSGGPHFLCFILLVICVLSLAMALSRAGVLLAAVMGAVFIVLALVQQIAFHWQGGRSLSVVVLTSVLLLTGGYFFLKQVDLASIEARFGGVEQTMENLERDGRKLARQATLDMVADRPVLGWGAGSFRYIFPMYQRNYPEIFYHYKDGNGKWVGRGFWRYAHCDWLQFLAEYGIIGLSLLGLSLVALVFPLIWHLHHTPHAILILLAGIFASMGHAFFDFIYHSPVVWLTFIGLLSLAGTLLRLETIKVESGKWKVESGNGKGVPSVVTKLRAEG